jgi:hypothetical protein
MKNAADQISCVLISSTNITRAVKCEADFRRGPEGDKKGAAAGVVNNIDTNRFPRFHKAA